MKEVVRVALRTVIGIGSLNFIAFVISAAYYGGAPNISLFNGAPATGPYFLNERGRLTEVSRQIFISLQWETRSAIVGIILVVICSWFLKRKSLR